MGGIFGLLQAQQSKPKEVVQFRRLRSLFDQYVQQRPGLGKILNLEQRKDKLLSDVHILS